MIKMHLWRSKFTCIARMEQHIVCGVMGILGFVGGGFHMHTLFLVLLRDSSLKSVR